MGATRNVMLLALIGLAISTPVDKSEGSESLPAESRSGPIIPSLPDPVRRDGAHHGGGGHHVGGHHDVGHHGGGHVSSFMISIDYLLEM